jgi:hypothetical protein
VLTRRAPARRYAPAGADARTRDTAAESLAAQTGAKHVYAIECSDIADTARQIVAANGYADRITIIKGKLEDVTLPVDKARCDAVLDADAMLARLRAPR